jgi:hypothetical protein
MAEPAHVTPEQIKTLRELPEPGQNALSELLSSELGISVTRERDAELTQIHRIVDRGRIKNEDEFRLVLSRVEEIHATPTAPASTRLSPSSAPGSHVT